jgi:hypothetical protein
VGRYLPTHRKRIQCIPWRLGDKQSGISSPAYAVRLSHAENLSLFAGRQKTRRRVPSCSSALAWTVSSKSSLTCVRTVRVGDRFILAVGAAPRHSARNSAAPPPAQAVGGLRQSPKPARHSHPATQTAHLKYTAAEGKRTPIPLEHYYYPDYRNVRHCGTALAIYACG